jgi:transcriptional regulator GlxA family with amidase domain
MLEQFQSEVDALLAGAAGRREITSPLVERMLRFIEDHYADPLTLDILAAEIGRSKRHAATLFRQHTGHTVHGFLTQVRVHHATDLIRAGIKIEAVSLLVGYRSKKNFYRHFKEQVGVTPFVYRTAMLGLLPRQARTPQE